jgi:endogenous inhibitor of DNA gyrase (YacG/DUF329 family)
MNAPERDDVQNEPRRAGGGRCPICGQPRSEAYRPFCSKRCADVDLGRWLSGSYAVPGSADEDEDGEEGEGAPAGGVKPEGGDS